MLDDKFFELVDAPEVRHGKVRVKIEVVRVASAFELTFHTEGVVAVMCDRCLDDVEMPIDADNRLIITFGEAYEEPSDEHVIVPEEEGAIDVSWFMYEFIALALPMRRVHEEGFCNEEIAKRLKELSVYDSEDPDISDSDFPDPEDGDIEKIIDPRWNALRNLTRDN